MSSSDLKRAYGLIKQGQYAAAHPILRAVCQREPENVNAWWLYAHTIDDLGEKRAALLRALQIDPFHEKANDALERLDAALATTANPAPTRGGGYLPLLMIAFLLVGLSLGAVVFMLQTEQPAHEETESLIEIPTQITAVGFAQAPATSTPRPPTPTPAPTQTPTPLPATWTPVPSNTAAFIPSPTPWLLTKTPLATANPALFGETYWEGINDGYSLDQFTRSGGRHMRFYEFPVKVYLDAPDNPIWQRALNNAIEQISPYVPIVQVLVETDATLMLKVLEPQPFQRYTGCSATESAGCGTIYDLGDFGGGDRFHRIFGEATVSTDSANPLGTMLHEILHALGLMVHSPYESDIMYPYETARTSLSQRDINTLRRLYANPSYAD